MTQADFWAIPDAKLVELQAELAKAREALDCASKELDGYERLLQPSDRQVLRLKARLAETYPATPRGQGMVYSLAHAEARRPLFAALTDLSEEFGGARAARARVRSQVRALLQDIARINKLLALAEKRKQRKAKP